jgi:WD40 repeat protein
MPVFSPDGGQVAIGDNRYKIILYDSITGKLKTALSGHTNIVFQIAYLEQYLFSCSSDGTARIWDLSDGKETVIFRGHTNPISRFDFSLKNRVLATADWEGTVRVWDSRLLSSDWILGWEISAKGELLATITQDRTLTVWDLVSMEILYSKSGINFKNSIAFDPGGKLLATTTGKEVILFDARTGKYLDSFPHAFEISILSFSPNSRHLATASGNGPVCIWGFDKDMNLSSHKSRHWLDNPYGYVNGLAFSPDSEILATGSADANVRLWSVSDGNQLKELPGHKSNVMSVTFSPDGSRLASASMDKTVKIWNLTPKQELLDPAVSVWTKELRTIKSHNYGVLSVVYDRKGERLATGSQDMTARIFDAFNGEELRTYRFPHVVHFVGFYLDGTYLVTGGFHNELYFYPLDFSKLLERAKERLTRKLTEAERERYHIK